MKRDDDQELWDLLGKAPPAAVSPFFARNVLREIRQERGWRQTAFGWLAPRWATAAAAALAVCIATAFLVSHNGDISSRSSEGDDVPEVVANIDPSDYEVVADLDDLLAAQEDDSWDDTATL
ncbi:MAG: hypothetical protein H0U43_01080 [Chthoniobacterales bacterium]|nr:hypothetical protein [Chthoniobacterales bacterium]